MIKLPAWAYYSLHFLGICWLLVLLIKKDWVGIVLLTGSYFIGRMLRNE